MSGSLKQTYKSYLSKQTILHEAGLLPLDFSGHDQMMGQVI